MKMVKICYNPKSNCWSRKYQFSVISRTFSIRFRPSLSSYTRNTSGNLNFFNSYIEINGRLF